MNGPNAHASSRLDVTGNNSDTPSPPLGADVGGEPPRKSRAFPSSSRTQPRYRCLGYLGGRLLLVGLLVANIALMAGCLATATLPPAQEEVSADWTEADERGLGADEAASVGDNER